MDSAHIASLAADLAKAFWETTQMVGISLAIAILAGVPLGLFLYVTSRELFWENSFLNAAGGFVVNVIRSTPFVILLVLLLPVTQRIVGSTIGPIAASVPLAVAATVFFARLVQASLYEIDRGVIEAALSFGATPLQIVKDVLVPEALPGLLRGLTVTTVSLIGYSAMAGIVGGGGVGDLAIRFGYYRYQTDVMFVTVAILIVLVQALQMAGDKVADSATKK
ncbi:MAG: methionine ABC transporter permease [Candidatus Baltobacteraceae bacterium]|jgi:D-methionine transport system permease protein